MVEAVRAELALRPGLQALRGVGAVAREGRLADRVQRGRVGGLAARAGRPRPRSPPAARSRSIRQKLRTGAIAVGGQAGAGGGAAIADRLAQQLVAPLTAAALGPGQQRRARALALAARIDGDLHVVAAEVRVADRGARVVLDDRPRRGRARSRARSTRRAAPRGCSRPRPARRGRRRSARSVAACASSGVAGRTSIRR